MTTYKKPHLLKIFSLSILGLSVQGSAQAYSLDVGDVQANIYGYVKLDAIHDLNADLGNAVNRSKIRLDDQAGPEGYTTLHAFQSRFGFTTATPAEGSELKTRIEGDFFGGGGGTFRLRHAYGEWKGLLAGQTWTNFGGTFGMTPIIDFAPQPGIGNSGRQAQLRYTLGGLSMSLEDPDDLGGSVAGSINSDNGTYNAADGHKSELPDFVLRYQNSYGIFDYGASAVLRYLEYDTTGTSDMSDSSLGWGLALEAQTRISDRVTLRGSVTHGDGIGGYLEQNPSAPAYVDPVSGSLETIRATGGTAGISLAAGDGDINLGYGFAKANLDDASAAGVANIAEANREFQSLYLNYIWSPTRNVTYGVEVGHHSREVQSGRSGDATRLQGMVKYSF